MIRLWATTVSLWHSLLVGMFLEVDFINVFHDFHAKGIFEKGFNASFITLIPKILVIDIKDFQPI
jgi:hypothetical protein